MGIVLSPIGQDIVRRGGDDSQSYDAMLINEIVARAPGLELPDLQAAFVAIMEEYGEDALFAVRNGYVKFEAVAAGTRPEVPDGE